MSVPTSDPGLLRSLGAELRRWRARAKLSQQRVADAVGVQRPTVAQWEGGRFPPAEDKIRLLDEVLETGGALAALAGSEHPGEGALSPSAGDSLTVVLDGVADRLVDGMLRDGDAIGWAHNIGRGTHPSAWSTALGVRTLLAVDRVDVDLELLARTMANRQVGGAWSNREPDVPRPDVTAVVLATLSRIGGGGAALDDAWSWLGTSIEPVDRQLTFVLSTALEHLAPLRPDSPVVAQLVRGLLAARFDFDGQRVWTSDPTASPDRVRPSVAHTARAVVALEAAPGQVDRPEVQAAIGEATTWLAANRSDDGITEIQRIDPERRGLDVPVDHFTSAYVVRALSGLDSVPASRLDGALETLWNAYVPADRVWAWTLSGRLPVWMNFDAVTALKAAAFATFISPPPRSPHRRQS